MSQGTDCHNSITVAHVALGANLAQGGRAPAESVAAAMRALADLPGTALEAASGVYATPCMPVGAGPDYANAVARLATSLGPEALMAELHALEGRFERQRRGRWAARTMDLDLLDWGGVVRPDRATWQRWADLDAEAQKIRTPETLILPHPRLQARAFVLVPLAEISPDWTHPVTGRTAARMAAELSPEERAGIHPLDPASGAPSGLAKQGDAR